MSDSPDTVIQRPTQDVELRIRQLMESALKSASRNDRQQAAEALRNAGLIIDPKSVNVDKVANAKHSAVLSALQEIERIAAERAVRVSNIESIQAITSQAEGASAATLEGIKQAKEFSIIPQLRDVPHRAADLERRLRDKMGELGINPNKSQEFRQSIFEGFLTGLALRMVLAERTGETENRNLKMGADKIINHPEIKDLELDLKAAKSTVTQVLRRVSEESHVSTAVVQAYFIDEL